MTSHLIIRYHFIKDIKQRRVLIYSSWWDAEWKNSTVLIESVQVVECGAECSVWIPHHIISQAEPNQIYMIVFAGEMDTKKYQQLIFSVRQNRPSIPRRPSGSKTWAAMISDCISTLESGREHSTRCSDLSVNRQTANNKRSTTRHDLETSNLSVQYYCK